MRLSYTLPTFRLLGTLNRFGLLFLAVIAFSQADKAMAAEDILVVRHGADSSQPETSFTEAELLALSQVTIRTRTEFTDGVVEFTGPLARSVLASIDLGDAKTVRLIAANDYSHDIALSDLYDYDAVLAMFMNGNRMSIRNKGPLWMMYPLDDHEELQDPSVNVRLVWQLVVMELR